MITGHDGALGGADGGCKGNGGDEGGIEGGGEGDGGGGKIGGGDGGGGDGGGGTGALVEATPVRSADAANTGTLKDVLSCAVVCARRAVSMLLAALALGA